MHTPETLVELSNEEVRDYLDALATEFYGTSRYKSDLARDADLTVSGVMNWFRKDGRPSPIMIFWMQDRLELRKLRGSMRSVAQVLEHVRPYLPEHTES